MTGPTGATGATGPTGTSVGGVVGGGPYNNPGSPSYLIPWGTTSNANEANAQIPVPAGTARNLFFHVSPGIGGGQTMTLIIRVNGTTPAGTLTCIIPAGQQSCSDTTHTVTFAAGDLLSVLYADTGAAGGRVSFSFTYLSQ